MNRQFVNQQEEWTPVSDWGRMMKPYLDQVKRKAVVVIRKPKVKRVRIRRNVCSAKRFCVVCGAPLGGKNKLGACSKCRDDYRQSMKSKRPVCACGVEMLRTNTSGTCHRCKKAAA